MVTETQPQPVDPKRALQLGVGVASPLWPGFLAAAGAGVAFWWWSQWTRGFRLNEAQLGALSMAKPAAAPATEEVVFDPVIEAPVVVQAAPAVDTVQAVAQPTARAADKRIEVVAEAAAPVAAAPAPQAAKPKPAPAPAAPPVKAATPAPAPSAKPAKAAKAAKSKSKPTPAVVAPVKLAAPPAKKSAKAKGASKKR